MVMCSVDFKIRSACVLYGPSISALGSACRGVSNIQFMRSGASSRSLQRVTALVDYCMRENLKTRSDVCS